MADSSSSSTPAGKKKFVRRNASEADSGDMGPMGAFSLLKTEAGGIQRYGVAGVLESKERLGSLLNPYLSGTTAKAHTDEEGTQWVDGNKSIYKELPDTFTKAVTETRWGSLR